MNNLNSLLHQRSPNNRRSVSYVRPERTTDNSRNSPKETLINCLSGRIAALRGARNLNIFLYMPRFLRSVRLALHPAQTINQHFPKAAR